MKRISQKFCSEKGISFDTFIEKTRNANYADRVFTKEYVEWLENELESFYTPIKIEPEPILLKAGDPRIHLGLDKTPTTVDCRVISEDVYQKLINRGKD